jgi:hypothetical protein
MTSLKKLGRLGAACIALAALAATTAHADAPGKGHSFLLLQLTNGDVSYAGPLSGAGYISQYAQTEWGGGAQYQHMLSDEWAIVLGGGIGTYKETDTPTAISGNPKAEYKQSSWNARLGADRFVMLSPKVNLFTGPGVGYWSGKAKTVVSGVSTERPKTTRIALDGRIGANVLIGKTWGLSGQIARYVSRSTAKDSGAKAEWWSSGSSGAVGLMFSY